MTQTLENSLRENVRKVFKGLTSEDFDILKFFYEKGQGSKYEASVNLKIPRATVYRKIQTLKQKGFLKVVDKKTFQRGSLKSEVEILTYTIKGFIATLGSNINLHKILESSPSEISLENSLITKITSYDLQLELFNRLFESLSDLNEDLTDKKVDLNLLFLNLMLKNPDYVVKLLGKAGVRIENLKVTREILKLADVLRKEFSGEVSHE
jgi:DNA-binding MarR family transcriptional regulator